MAVLLVNTVDFDNKVYDFGHAEHKKAISCHDINKVNFGLRKTNRKKFLSNVIDSRAHDEKTGATSRQNVYSSLLCHSQRRKAPSESSEITEGINLHFKVVQYS